VTYRYAVNSVQTYDKATAPLQEIVGPTSAPSLTIITDAGQPDAVNGGFDRSLVIRAVREA